MVANQSVGPIRDHKGLSAALTKLRMDKDKKKVQNLPEWKESLKNAFLTFGLAGFLRKEFGQQVPPDQVGPILIKEEVDKELARLEREYTARAKEEKLRQEVTSVAVKEGSKYGDPEGTPPTAVELLTTHWPKVEAMVRQNAETMHETNMGKRASAEQLGEHWGVLYVNPYTRVETESKFLNPRAVVSLGKSDPYWKVLRVTKCSVTECSVCAPYILGYK